MPPAKGSHTFLLAALLAGLPYFRHITSPPIPRSLTNYGDLRSRRIKEIQLSAAVRGNIGLHSPHILSIEAQIWLVRVCYDTFNKYRYRPPTAAIPGLATRRKEIRALRKAVDAGLSQEWR